MPNIYEERPQLLIYLFTTTTIMYTTTNHWKKRLMQVTMICLIMFTLWIAITIPKWRQNRTITKNCNKLSNKIEQLYCHKVELVTQRKRIMGERDAYVQEVQTQLWVMNKKITGVNSQIFAIDQQIHQEQWEWVEYDMERIEQLLIPTEMGNLSDPQWSEKLSDDDIWLQIR